MIQESLIDHAINRLSAHFGGRVVIRPPATAADLADLESLVGPLPRDLTLFLSTCNGLRVNIAGFAPLGHLWHVHEIREALAPEEGPRVPDGLLPIRGEAGGESDCIVLEAGRLHGAVVRCDTMGSGAELVASGFGRYVDCWTKYLITNYAPDGTAVSKDAAPPFDASFTARHNPELGSLAARDDVRSWLHELDGSVACGDDFE